MRGPNKVNVLSGFHNRRLCYPPAPSRIALQSLWTQARGNVHVNIVIYANSGDKVLSNERKRVGASTKGAPAASMFDLENPTLNWTALTKGMGVHAVSESATREFEDAFSNAMKQRGPIECAI
jgi:acetolactate synthase-1/2/3 large subunit